VDLLCELVAAWEHSNIAARIDLCGDSDQLDEHAPELLTKDEDGDTPLDLAKLNSHPAGVSSLPQLRRRLLLHQGRHHEAKLAENTKDKAE